jgi:beta-glucosidase
MHEQFNARARQAAEQGDIDLIFLGDSITFQWSDPGRSVWDEFYANRHAVNLGIGGDRTQHILWRIQNGNLDGLATPAKGTPPKLVVLMIGTNNSADDSAQDIASGIRADVAMIREKLPATKVLLLAVFPRGERPNALRDRVATASELARPIADGTMVFYLDIRREFVEVDGTIRKEIMPDFIHLSTEGYRRWAVAIEPMVRQLMGESAK